MVGDVGLKADVDATVARALDFGHGSISLSQTSRSPAFLASDAASYVNGQAIAVDGGLSTSHPVVPGKMA